jgi:hypothetical protein
MGARGAKFVAAALQHVTQQAVLTSVLLSSLLCGRQDAGSV